MAQREEEIKIYDQKGFYYYVKVKHWPQLGVTSAHYDDRIIASREYGRILEPIDDDDRDWERYEELYAEWRDAAISDLTHECENHFNQQYKNGKNHNI